MCREHISPRRGEGSLLDAAFTAPAPAVRRTTSHPMTPPHSPCIPADEHQASHADAHAKAGCAECKVDRAFGCIKRVEAGGVQCKCHAATWCRADGRRRLHSSSAPVVVQLCSGWACRRARPTEVDQEVGMNATPTKWSAFISAAHEGRIALCPAPSRPYEPPPPCAGALTYACNVEHGIGFEPRYKPISACTQRRDQVQG